MTQKRFDGKVVLITGATSGIGRVTALEFAKEGATLVLAGRRESEGAQVVSEIESLGGEAIFLKTDVTQEEQVAALVSKGVERFGRIDAAFNNAGVEGVIAPTVEQTAENYRHTFDINVLGVLLCMKYQIQQMLKNGGGAIVNNASIAGVIGMPGGTVYFGTKHAVLGMTKCAALETAENNIRINAVSPGMILTDMAERFTGGSEEAKAQFAAMHPMKRAGQSEEVAKAVLFLCSSDASFTTGQNIMVDGGYTAQ